MPTIIKTSTTHWKGGIEQSLEGFADFFTFAGVLGCAGFFLLSLVASSSGFSFGAVVLGIGAAMLLGGLFARAVTRTLADLVRLQKKANGIPFSGRISEAKGRQTESLSCSACGAPIASVGKKCANCNAVFDSAKS